MAKRLENKEWRSVPQFGGWDQKTATPDYSMVFSKARANKKHNKAEFRPSTSLGTEEEFMVYQRYKNNESTKKGRSLCDISAASWPDSENEMVSSVFSSLQTVYAEDRGRLITPKISSSLLKEVSCVFSRISSVLYAHHVSLHYIEQGWPVYISIKNADCKKDVCVVAIHLEKNYHGCFSTFIIMYLQKKLISSYQSMQ
ncbi:unnamed protein product [Musa acuminata subsp. burmannicoides]